MFHFAGGNSYSYRFMEPYLKEFDVETLELPGRGARSDEMLLRDFTLAADDLFEQLHSRLKAGRFLIYGHSMGALLALKVTHMLEERGICPGHLIVTGNAGPNAGINEKRYLLNDNEFVLELKKLGGLSSEFLQSEELLHYFLPILKADFEISEENGLARDLKVKTPVYALMGDTEKYSTAIANWADYTASGFTSELCEGNHFFIHKHAEALCHVIRNCYQQLVPSPLTSPAP